MHQEAILLELDPYAVKSYNAMQAALAINAVDSQRIDQVCFFEIPYHVESTLSQLITQGLHVPSKGEHSV